MPSGKWSPQLRLISRPQCPTLSLMPEPPMNQSHDTSTPPEAAWIDFHPPLLRVQLHPPSPIGRQVLWVLVTLVAFVLAWSFLGRLDIVAVAEGRIIPESYLKILQPAEAGIVRELHVREGDRVHSGQVLMQMDAKLSDADAKALEAEYQRKRLSLLRIEAELGGASLDLSNEQPQRIAGEIAAQYRANHTALASSLAEESSRLARARKEQAAAEQTQLKLEEVLPHYKRQEEAFNQLVRQGFAGDLMASDKRRELIEKTQELATQKHIIASARARVEESASRLAQIEADYHRALHAERQEVLTQLDRLTEE